MQIIFDPRISEWDNPVEQTSTIPQKREANAGNWNILVPVGRENKNDSPSSGERTGKSPNHRDSGPGGVVGLRDCKKYGEKK